MGSRGSLSTLLRLLVLLGIVGWSASSALAQSIEQLEHMSIEDLGNVEISSVSKANQPLNSAPAAIFVITHEDIVRSGATSLPEILRLAPNLQVAQITASRYAISARGFNSSAADKLLVLIDGRSVYTPFFSGVLWNLQDVPAENIERVEVISGPGATLWGANAVNGVINIVTRKSSESQGGVLELGGGNLEQRGLLQYGGKIGDDLSYRAFVSGFRYADDRTASGANAQDGWHNYHGGFRTDWTPGADTITLQGDYFRGLEDELTTANETITGHNLLARWTHQFDGDSAVQIQAYYDHIGEVVPNDAAEYLDTYDLDLQHSFTWGSSQKIVWGGGYRVIRDDFPTVITPSQLLFFNPQSATLGLGNVFVEDTISLTDRIKLIPGLKLEKDPYTRLEPLPSLRLSWQVDPTDLVWTAVSRAIRAPSRLDRDLFENIGPTAVIAGGDFQPEELIAYELGYRTQRWSGATLSVSTFYNVYTDLRSAELSPGGTLPIVFGNGMAGDTYGIEVWGTYQLRDWWKLAAGANWLHKNLHFIPGSAGIGGIEIAGDDPTYQLSLRSTMSLRRDLDLELDLRRIGALPAPPSPAYTELNTCLTWRVSSTLELALRGDNLLHAHHLEFGSTSGSLQVGAIGVETGRSVFLDTRWRF